MVARRQITNKLWAQNREATKADKGAILDRVVDITGMGRSTARRMLAGPLLPVQAAGVSADVVLRGPHWRAVNEPASSPSYARPHG